MTWSEIESFIYATLFLPREKPKSPAHTYGELLATSIEQFEKHITVYPTDVWLDLGSGLGKAVLQLFWQTNAHCVIGIEYCPNRYQVAIHALNRLQQYYPEHFANRQVSFILGDFLTTDWSEATLVFICATAYPLPLLYAIAQKLNQYPNIRAVITLRPLPFLTHLRYQKRWSVEGSWDSGMAYLYERLS